ncbi:type VI secretion system baseplate subunit TssE [Enterobacterales bacterium CwR94]|nr:type VI secretion system baseplate subunit TssE [Enterobacterales bacterium CwR94]
MKNNRRKPWLPCLLDRLLDDEPRKQVETWDRYHFDARALRKIIQQNIAEILNTANIEERLHPLRHRYTAGSVLNYGISPQVGGYSTPHNWSDLERMIRDALIRFEPRLIPDSIVINLIGDRQAPACNGIIQFDIRALVWWDPQPFDLAIGARYDLETDSASVTLNH